MFWLLFISVCCLRKDPSLDYYAVKLKSTSNIQRIELKFNARCLGNVGELPNYFWFSFPKLAKRSLNFLHDDSVEWSELQVGKQNLFKRSFKDPLFDKQWHLVNPVTGNDINVSGLWSLGITGTGSIVAFIDDGVDYEHPDLRDHFSFETSYDFNDHSKKPTPKLIDDYHGTRCAAEVSAAPNNNVCGVGVAYNAQPAGIRILSGHLTDADQASAINYAYDRNQIYSCSWGPKDDGQTMERPPSIVADAFENGAKNGRNGLGSIFVFASGNGGVQDDNCNFDGYTNSIYTLTVAAIDRHNHHPPYSEPCSANLVSTYSGEGFISGIYTSDLHGKCTSKHSGTSAAAPIVAGILALVMQVRPDLTWRDVQYLCAQTAIPINLEDSGWQNTTVPGRLYNHKFGFGKLDAYHTVQAARLFASVNDQTQMAVDSNLVHQVNSSSVYSINIDVTEAMVQSANATVMEHIRLTFTTSKFVRRDINVKVLSPGGVESFLIPSRKWDSAETGFSNWTATSVANWYITVTKGRQPYGHLEAPCN